jgi:hypothetical protein
MATDKKKKKVKVRDLKPSKDAKGGARELGQLSPRLPSTRGPSAAGRSR